MRCDEFELLLAHFPTLGALAPISVEANHLVVDGGYCVATSVFCQPVLRWAAKHSGSGEAQPNVPESETGEPLHELNRDMGFDAHKKSSPRMAVAAASAWREAFVTPMLICAALDATTSK